MEPLKTYSPDSCIYKKFGDIPLDQFVLLLNHKISKISELTSIEQQKLLLHVKKYVGEHLANINLKDCEKKILDQFSRCICRLADQLNEHSSVTVRDLMLTIAHIQKVTGLTFIFPSEMIKPIILQGPNQSIEFASLSDIKSHKSVFLSKLVSNNIGKEGSIDLQKQCTTIHAFRAISLFLQNNVFYRRYLTDDTVAEVLDFALQYKLGILIEQCCSKCCWEMRDAISKRDIFRAKELYTKLIQPILSICPKEDLQFKILFANSRADVFPELKLYEAEYVYKKSIEEEKDFQVTSSNILEMIRELSTLENFAYKELYFKCQDVIKEMDPCHMRLPDGQTASSNREAFLKTISLLPYVRNEISYLIFPLYYNSYQDQMPCINQTMYSRVLDNRICNISIVCVSPSIRKKINHLNYLEDFESLVQICRSGDTIIFLRFIYVPPYPEGPKLEDVCDVLDKHFHDDERIGQINLVFSSPNIASDDTSETNLMDALSAIKSKHPERKLPTVRLVKASVPGFPSLIEERKNVVVETEKGKEKE